MNLLAALASVRIFPRKVSHQTLTTRWGKALDPQHILEEYPRPQMIRDQYINLNGEWNYTVLSEKNTITKEGTAICSTRSEKKFARFRGLLAVGAGGSGSFFSGSPSFRCRFPVKAARKNAL